MRNGTTKFLTALFMAALLTAGMTGTVRAAEFVIGVGDGARVHFHIGRALCRVIKRSIQGASCEAKQIEGRDQAEPLAVLNNVRNGAIEIGIVQSDWIHHAYKGSGPAKFGDEKYTNLRTLFVLHGEPFTVVARQDARITKLDDLAGKRVNIGQPRSRQRVVMEQVMAAKGWTRDTFQVADELAGPEQSLALCHNRIQAMVVTVAHPDPDIRKTLKLCGAEIVEIAGQAIDKLIAQEPYFTVITIPAGTYETQADTVKSFGARVAAVTSEDMPEDLVYAVVKAVFENLDSFKRLHPGLGHLQAKDLMKNGVTAPLHPGAVRYFREAGLM